MSLALTTMDLGVMFTPRRRIVASGVEYDPKLKFYIAWAEVAGLDDLVAGAGATPEEARADLMAKLAA